MGGARAGLSLGMGGEWAGLSLGVGGAWAGLSRSVGGGRRLRKEEAGAAEVQVFGFRRKFTGTPRAVLSWGLAG